MSNWIKSPTDTNKSVLYSILDLVRVGEEWGVSEALNRARDLAAHAETWGYSRFWVAEHHNMVSIASSATSLVISHIAAGTKKIRVGAGGIMLPNHSPLVIAEQFGTLAHLYPGRIDLGLGRAPGTDQVTLRALRRSPASAESFPNDVLELQALLGPSAPGQNIHAIPGEGTEVPLWILGSSTFGANLAAQFGLPYGFASHFAPSLLATACRIYRESFQPSEQLAKPHLLVGINVIVAETDSEAKKLATTQQMSFADLVRGKRALSRPPIDDIEQYWTAAEKAHAVSMLDCSFYGSPETVKGQLKRFLETIEPDELMVVTDVYDHALRLRSYELLSQILNEVAPQK